MGLGWFRGQAKWIDDIPPLGFDLGQIQAGDKQNVDHVILTHSTTFRVSGPGHGEHVVGTGTSGQGI